MAKLKVRRESGTQEFEISPIIQYAFEQQHKGKGINKVIIEDDRETDVFWLAWECIRRSGETVPPFGEKFIETLVKVELLPSDPLD